MEREKETNVREGNVRFKKRVGEIATALNSSRMLSFGVLLAAHKKFKSAV